MKEESRVSSPASSPRRELRIFAVLEGLDGTGKTTAARAVAAALMESGHKAVYRSTPGDGFRESVRYVSEYCEVDARFLFHVAAVRHASDQFRRDLETSSVICDRYIYSTLAYHRAGGSSVRIDLESLNLLMPTHAFLLRIPDEERRQQRVLSRGNPAKGDTERRQAGNLIDRIEREFTGFPLVAIDNTGDLSTTIATILGHLQ